MGFEVPKVGFGVGGVSPYDGGGAKGVGTRGVGTPHVGTGEIPEFRGTPEKSSLVARLDAMDARDIGLKGDRSGFDGQKYLNYVV